MIDNRKNKIHPYKFNLWVAIGSILMMFAGLTSAYIVKRNMANWETFDIPSAFWYSTIVIALSSATLWLALKSFKERAMGKYRMLMLATFVLGLAFVGLQFVGFYQLVSENLALGQRNSVDFLYIIVGLHGLHVVGGIVVLLIMAIKAFGTKTRNYSSVPVELISIYWHFVGILWVYLLLFLLMIK